MNSSLIGKIEKARRYAEEPERIKIQSFQATFQGANDLHSVHMDGNEFSCNCHFFKTSGEGTCCHIMALQRILTPMLTEEQQHAGAAVSMAIA